MKVVIEKIDNFTASKKYPPTNAQWQAIGMSGCDILVSAAAGSGKTEVLSDRISRKIAIDKWNIDEILVLTFTTAAAQNMLDRIEAKIEERLLVSGSYEDLFHLKQQRLKIGNAKISTIDSFCLEVLKKFYYLVEENIDGEIRYLSPNFKVLSNNSSLLNQSVSNVLENLAKDNNEFLDFLFSIYGKKTEILTMLTNLYKKILSIPNYREYLQKDFIKTNIFSNSDYISLERSIKHITKDNVYNELENITLFLSKFLEIITTEKSISEHITDLLISEHEEILNKINFDTDANEVENNFESSQFKKEYVESALLNIQN